MRLRELNGDVLKDEDLKSRVQAALRSLKGMKISTEIGYNAANDALSIKLLTKGTLEFVIEKLQKALEGTDWRLRYKRHEKTDYILVWRKED